LENILASLLSADRAFFLFLNHAFANPFLDRLMPIVTEEDNWRIPILLIWLSLMIFGGKKGRITAVLILFVAALSDWTVNALLKPWVGRMRPCFVLENVRCLIDQPKSPSFPSSHAANMAAMATLFSIRYRKYTTGFVLFAFFISASRVYVGVHYPSDLFAGWCVGILCAVSVLAAGRGITGLVLKLKGPQHEKAIRKDTDRANRRRHHRVADGRRR
jgi:undecaprenyl-diphosphatase